MTEHEALMLALEALEAISGSSDDPNNGWRGKGTDKLFACEYCQQVSEDCSKIPHLHKCPVPKAYPAITAIREALEKPPQSQREWQGLTDEDCLEALKTIDPETKRLPLGFSMFAAAIQSKLKEKNT